MCGILGILDLHKPVAPDLYLGAMALQHRGQDGAGMTTFEKRFYQHTGLGLLVDVFRDRNLDSFPGKMGLAHLRYATAGVGGGEECQPFIASYPLGLALVHNGNLTNDAQLRERLEARGHRHVNSLSDSETLLNVFADALARGELRLLTAEQVMRAAQLTMATLEGAYSVVIMIANHGLLAFRDPRGIRPLVMGRREGAVIFASESVALDAVDAVLERDVQPGEAIFVDTRGQVHAEQLYPSRPAHCVFEYIYLARPESVIDGRSVSEVREALGTALATRFAGQGKPEVAFDVPSSAEDAAISFARTAGIPYRKGIRKNQYIHRSFIAANPQLRSRTVTTKFNFELRVINGKRVAVIDDSIVRGTTARFLIARLRRQGAQKVYFFSASPPVRYPCIYGVDMAIRSDLVAATMTHDSTVRFLDVDYLQYQSVQDLDIAVGQKGICDACFTGNYPTPVDEAAITRIEELRVPVSGTGELRSDRLNGGPATGSLQGQPQQAQ